MALQVTNLAVGLDAPYVRPNQKITEFVALGDSWTAGIGSNGRPDQLGGPANRGRSSYPFQMLRDEDMWEYINNGPGTYPRLTYLAHSGDGVRQLLDKQLAVQGNWMPRNWDKARGMPFGNPQIAVITLGGNDAGFIDILNDCVYRMHQPKNCQDTIVKTQRKINDGSLESKIRYALREVARAGRAAGGADPPESFQVYVPEYISAFNHDNPECDNVSWHFYWFLGRKNLLTRALRRTLNNLVEQVNDVLKRAAQSLENMGVIYVGGIMPLFDGHRFCEPGQTSPVMDHPNTWFWSPYSLTNTTSEGPSHYSAISLRQTLDQELLDFVFANETLRTSHVTPDSPPWTWEGAEKYPSFLALLDAIQEASAKEQRSPEQNSKNGFPKIDWVRLLVSFGRLRSFHPKATGHRQVKDMIFAAIANNRDGIVG